MAKWDYVTVHLIRGKGLSHEYQQQESTYTTLRLTQSLMNIKNGDNQKKAMQAGAA